MLTDSVAVLFRYIIRILTITKMLKGMKKTKERSFGKSTVHLLRPEEEEQILLLNVMETIFISAVKDDFDSLP